MQYLRLMPVKVAVKRLGGPQAAGRALGVTPAIVKTWLAPHMRVEPAPEVLAQMSQLAGIDPRSFEDYLRKLRAYKESKKQRD